MRGIRNVSKGAVSIVAIQSVGSSSKVIGRTIDRKCFEAALLCCLNIVIEIIYDQEIDKTIIVVVEPSSRNCPGLTKIRDVTANACFSGHVSECTVAIIVKELVSIHTSNVQIYKAIVVVVSGGHTHGIADSLQPRLFSNIGKSTIAVIPIKAVVIVRTRFLERGNARAIREENVEQPIVVVVKHRNSPGHGLDGISLRANGVHESEADPGALYDVLE